MKPSEVLLEAKNKILMNGWRQGVGRNDQGRYCVLGAVGEVTGISETFHEANKYLGSVIDQRFIFTWNDTPGRTQQEVLDAFDAAISLAKDNNE